jgi:Big-like domain-containing protein/VCBS repeat protein
MKALSIAGAALCALIALPLSAICRSTIWTTQQARTDASWLIYDVDTLDYDGDHVLDVVGLAQDTNGGSATIYGWRGVGNGTFEVPVSLGTSGISHMIVADVNNDGRRDLIAGGSSGQLIVRLGNGQGFNAAITGSAGVSVSRLLAVSIDGDAFVDLIASSTSNGFLDVFHGEGNGTFTKVKRVTTTAFPWMIAAADFDADGRVDVAYSHLHANTIDVIFRNSDGSYTAPVTLQSGMVPEGSYVSYVTDLKTADVDEDGRPDLVATNWEDQRAESSVAILRNAGSRTFTRSVLVPEFSHPSHDFNSLRVVDLDADGHADLVASSVNSDGLVMTFHGKGDGTFYSPSYYKPAAGSGILYSIATGDFDGDGDPDLAVASYKDFIAAKGACGTQAFLFTISPVITQGQPAPLRVLVSGVGAPNPAPLGTVTFRDGATVLGTVDIDAGGHAQLDASGLALGDHTVTADFSGNAAVPPATSQSVVQKVTTAATTTSLLLPAAPPVYGTPYTVNVEIRSPFGTTITALYMLDVDGVRSERNSAVPVSLQLTAGPHTITASYLGDAFYPPSTSGPRPVTAAKATPSIGSTGALSVRAGTAHTLQFTMTGLAGSPGPTGTIQLKRGATVLASGSVSNGGGTLSNGTATLSATLERGTHDVKAVYLGDANFNSATLDLMLSVLPNLEVAIDAHGLQNAISIRALFPPGTQNATLFRSPAGAGAWTTVTGWPQSEYDTQSPARGVLYDYRLTATVSDVAIFSNVDSAMLFTDDTVTGGATSIRRVHFDELRLAVNGLRTAAGLPPVAFDATYAGFTIRASHLATLRTGLAEARQSLGMLAAAFTDSATAGTPIKAVHIQELRDQVR